MVYKSKRGKNEMMIAVERLNELKTCLEYEKKVKNKCLKLEMDEDM